jgi:hypothetical protein
MAKPHIHALSSARKFGGKPEDYVDLHNWMDRSKEWFPDNRHRVFTHHTQGIFELARVFGDTRVNSDGKTYSVRDVGEQHVSEDFQGKYVPDVSDYLQEMNMLDWMNNGKGYPPSFKKVQELIDRKRAERPNVSESFFLDGSRKD